MSGYPGLSPNSAQNNLYFQNGNNPQISSSAPSSPGGMGNAMMSPNAMAFQPGGMPSLSPRGSFGDQGHPSYFQQQKTGLPYAGYQQPISGSPIAYSNFHPSPGMAQGQRAPAPTGLTLNASAPVFQLGGGHVGGNGVQQAMLSPGGLSPLNTFAAKSQPVSPIMPGARSPLANVFSPASPNSQAPTDSQAFDNNNTSGNIVSTGTVGWGANSISAARQNRRGRSGLTNVNQPIRTSGHNSKPSVSLNPAAFSAALAAQKPKRKVTIRLPIEIEEEGEENVFRHTITEEEDEDQESSSEASVQFIRSKWIRRQPLKDIDVNDISHITPEKYITSCEIYPSIDENSQGLPDFVDIYLPGQSAWDELREVFAQERLKSEAMEVQNEKGGDLTNQTSVNEIDRGWGLGTGGGDGGTFGISTEKEMKKSSNTNEEEDFVPPLKEELTPRRAAHLQTMSLSIPSSGLPFGPSTLTALGLPSPSEKEQERSYSDSEDRNEPALGVRPRIDRLGSDPAIHKEVSTPTKNGQSNNVSWRDLGRGFGYDIPEADEENLTDEEDASITQKIQKRNRKLDNEVEVRSNSSEDADASDLEDEDRIRNDPSWLKQRRRISGMPVEAIHSVKDLVDDVKETNSMMDEVESFSEEYSNPSEEETARAARELRRAERRAAIEAGNINRTSILEGGNRPRAATGETIASSSLGGSWNPQESDDISEFIPMEGINVMSRGPLDSTNTSMVNQDGIGNDSTISRATRSAFRPNAPTFTPGDPNPMVNASTGHFRLPSLANSSFGGSMKGSLNATAPTFVPGSFTFTAPGNAPKLPQLLPASSNNSISTSQITQRESQGREKRFRHQNGDQSNESIDNFTMLSSPPRPKPSAASIESALRGEQFDGNAATFAPPFNASLAMDDRLQAGFSANSDSYQASPQPTLGTFSFQPTAAPFQPTIGRSAGRAGIPSFEPPTSSSVDHQAPQSDFTFSIPQQQHVPVSIRHPDERAEAFQANVNGQQFKRASERFEESSDIISNPDDEIHLNAGRNQEEEDEDDDTVSDIIEELGERMDRALEGWAGKILDEVTIMGQVRPVNMVTLDSMERKTLIEAVGREIGDLLADYHDRLQERLLELDTHVRQRQRGIQASENSTDDSRFDGSIMSEKKGNLIEMSSQDQSVTPGTTIIASAPISTATSVTGHPQLNTEGDLQFDFVQDILDQKISNLQRELHAAFDTALPRAMENVSRQIKDTIDSSRIEAAIQRLDELQEKDSDRSIQYTTPKGPVELSIESSETIAALLLGRMQAVMDEIVKQVKKDQYAGLSEVMEPMFAENLMQVKSRNLAEREEVKEILMEVSHERRDDFDKILMEIKDVTGDQLQATLMKSILPHIETLRSDSTVDVDLIVGRVTEILVPLIARADRADNERVRQRNAQNVNHFDAADLSTAIVEQLRPLLASKDNGNQSLFDAGEIDPDLLAERVADLVKKDITLSREKGESGLDINAIIAFLEPLVQKQDETRLLSRKTLDKQNEMEMSLSALPSAVNSKMEVVMAISQSIQDGHETISKKLEAFDSLHEILNNLASSNRSIELDNGGDETIAASNILSARISQLESQREEIENKIEEVRKEKHAAEAEAIEARAELKGSLEYTKALKEELEQTKLNVDVLQEESRQKDDLITKIRESEQVSLEAKREIEKEMIALQAKVGEFESNDANRNEIHLTLREQLEQLQKDLQRSNDERALERQNSAQLASDSMARCERAEESLRVEQSRCEMLLEQIHKSEESAKKQTGDALQRAAKAEGEVAGLEKRINDQDGKIASLQQVNATQKQKAAQSGQKLSEIEKRLREFESSDRELHVARARLQDMETRISDREEISQRLQNSIDVEARLREELAGYQARFLDMERDLMSMRETLVGKDELEQSQADLTTSREEIAELRGQLAERDRRIQEQNEQHRQQLQEYQKHFEIRQRKAPLSPIISSSSKDIVNNVLPRSPSHGSSTWASIYAPTNSSSNEDHLLDPNRKSNFIDESFESTKHHIRSSNLSTISNSRAVELSNDGWWS